MRGCIIFVSGTEKSSSIKEKRSEDGTRTKKVGVNERPPSTNGILSLSLVMLPPAVLKLSSTFTKYEDNANNNEGQEERETNHHEVKDPKTSKVK